MKKVLAMVFSIILFVSLLTVSTIEVSANFKDIPRDHWAYNEIKFLTDKKVITNCSNCKYEPLSLLTRKDAAIMLARSLKLNAPQKVKVVPSDMKANVNGYKQVIAVLDRGIFTLSNKKFNPNQSLTRKEMARALAIAYNYKGKGKTNYKDVPKGSSYYPYVDAIIENDIGSGYKEPLEYVVKENGKIIYKTKDADSAIQLAIKHPKATVHPVSNSLITYSDKTALMNSTGIRNGVLIYNGAKEKIIFLQSFLYRI